MSHLLGNQQVTTDTGLSISKTKTDSVQLGRIREECNYRGLYMRNTFWGHLFISRLCGTSDCLTAFEENVIDLSSRDTATLASGLSVCVYITSSLQVEV